MKRRILLVALAAVLMIFAFVSCSNEVAPKEDKLGTITFGSDGRAVGYAVKYSEEVENLYWYYSAEKLDDGYKTGATGYTPVTSDNTQGLSGKTLNSSSGFSYGYWKIELRGFTTNDASLGKTDANATYKATINNFLVSADRNSATAEIEMGEGATTSIVFSTVDGISFESDNIKSTSSFTLAVTDTVDKKTVGTVTVSEDARDKTVTTGKVTYKNLTYTPNSDADIVGTHKMEFVLTQTLTNSGDTNQSTIITAAKYTLNFEVKKGTITTISGTLLKNDDTGDILINGVQDLKPITMSKIIPVDSTTVDDTNKVATVSGVGNDGLKVEYGDFSTTIPEGAKITTNAGTGSDGSTLSTLDSDKKTSDATFGFEYKGEGSIPESDSASQTQTITIAGSSAVEEYTLTLPLATSNNILVPVTKKVSSKPDGIYHNSKKLETASNQTETDPNDASGTRTKEYWTWNGDTNSITLYLYHASPIYLVIQKPVASIETTEYTTLSEAVTAASNNAGAPSTIRLLNDLNLNEEIKIGKNIILDMNNKVLKLVTADGKTGSVTVSTNGVLTVKNKNAEQEHVVTGVEVTSYTGESKYYPTFDAALAGASNGDTVTLYKEEALANDFESTKSLTINLNNQTLGVTDEKSITVKSSNITVTGAASGQASFITGVNSKGKNSIDGTYSPRAVSVKIGETTTYYATIEAAFAAAEENAVITLLDNVTISKPITVTKSVSLVLDGKTVTSSGDNLIYISSGILSINGADSAGFVSGAKSSSEKGKAVYSPRIARINSTYYATFKDALDGAASGDVIYLVSDATLSGTVTLDKDITIVLNQKTLSVLGTDGFVVRSNVTFRNGNIIGSKGSTFIVCDKGTLNLDAVNVENINGYSFKKEDNSWAVPGIVYLYQGSNPAVLNVKNSVLTMEGVYGIATNASDGGTYVEINIENSTITTKDSRTASADHDNTALLVNVDSIVNISGSTISGERQGAVLRGTGKKDDAKHKVTISNSTIEATDTGTFEKRTAAWGSGNEVAIAALVIGNKDGKYPRPTTVELDNVTLKVDNNYKGKQIWVYQQSEDYLVAVDGFDENWTVNNDFNGATVKSTDGKTIYTSGVDSFENAVSEATSGQTIKLLSDLDLTKYSCSSDGKVTGRDYEFEENVTFDLNGKTVHYNNYGVVWRGNKLTIQNGSFRVSEDTSKSSGYGSYALFIRGTNDDSALDDTEKKNWVTYIKNITCKGGINAGCHKLEIDGENTSVEGTNYRALWADENCEITVKDGTYYAGNSDVVDASKSDGKISIEGGTFDASRKGSVFGNIGGEIIATGGTFIPGSSAENFKETLESHIDTSTHTIDSTTTAGSFIVKLSDSE